MNLSDKKLRSFKSADDLFKYIDDNEEEKGGSLTLAGVGLGITKAIAFYNWAKAVKDQIDKYKGEYHVYLLNKYNVPVKASYAGAGTNILKRVKNNDKPVSVVDLISKIHDIQYYLAQTSRTKAEQMKRVRKADDEMLKMLKIANEFKLDKQINITLAQFIIKQKTKLEDKNILFLSDTIKSVSGDLVKHSAKDIKLLEKAKMKAVDEFYNLVKKNKKRFSKKDMKGGGLSPSYPYIVISKEERDDAFNKIKELGCDINNLTLSHTGNKASNYYFQPYREKTKVGKWSHWTAWNNPEKRKRIMDIDKSIHRDSPKIIGTPTGLQSAMRMGFGSVNQFKPYIAVCVYQKFKPKRILDISAGWGDRLIGAMAQNIDYIGIDSNTSLKKPYTQMINDFKNKSSSKVNMIFKKSQDVDYSKLPPYDLIFTSPPYFDLEKYEGMELYDSEKEFIDKYWRPTIEPAYKYLQSGGRMVLNMPEEMYQSIVGVIGKASSKIKMPIANRDNWKKDGVKKFEYMYVWDKSTALKGGSLDSGGCKYKIKIDNIKLDDGRTINVIRDDLIEGGTKVRLLNKIVPKISNKTLVYATPKSGYAQVALSIVGKKYNKKVVVFVAKSKVMSDPTTKAKNNGATIKEVERPAYLNVVQSRAKKWSEDNNAYLMPFGLDEGDNVDILSNEIKKCLPSSLKSNSKINMWLVAGSGMILRGLYNALPSATFNVVQVGKKLTDYNKNNTKVYISPLEFDKNETILPPYPSVDNYDAKVWRFVVKHAKDGDYVYNIAGDTKIEKTKGGSLVDVNKGTANCKCGCPESKLAQRLHPTHNFRGFTPPMNY